MYELKKQGISNDSLRVFWTYTWQSTPKYKEQHTILVKE